MKYPGFPKLKLKFNIQQTTLVKQKVVIDLLASKLQAKEYKILEETNDSVTFYNNPWRPRWNFQRYIPLDGGKIEVGIAHNGNLINFSYYLDLLPVCAALSLMLYYTINDREYDGALFFTCFFFIASVIAIFRAKWEAKRILKEVLNEDQNN